MTVAPDFSSYNVTLGGVPWLHSSATSPVSIQCSGQRYQASVNLTFISASKTSGGTAGAGAGVYAGYAAQWKAGGCTSLTTEVRFYVDFAAFEFITTIE
eukprot:gene14526-23597_t